MTTARVCQEFCPVEYMRGMGVHGTGLCIAGGVHGWVAMHGIGVCMVGAVFGACMAGETATAADGTLPTGMHSRFFDLSQTVRTESRFDL